MVFAVSADASGWGLRMKIQIHEHAPREHGCGFQLSPKSPLDQLLDHLFSGNGFASHHRKPLGLKGDEHGDFAFQGIGVEFEFEILHFPDLDALVLHGRATGQAPHGFVEVEHVETAVQKDLFIDAFTVGIQGEHLVLGHRAALFETDGCLEGDAAEEGIHQGIRLHADPRGVHGDIQGPRVPEPGFTPYQRVVGRIDEDHDGDRFPSLVQIESRHIAHPDLPVAHR